MCTTGSTVPFFAVLLQKRARVGSTAPDTRSVLYSTLEQVMPVLTGNGGRIWPVGVALPAQTQRAVDPSSEGPGLCSVQLCYATGEVPT